MSEDRIILFITSWRETATGVN